MNFNLIQVLSLLTKKRKSAQLGVKSVNIKFIGHEFQFDPSFIPLNEKRKSAQLGV